MGANNDKAATPAVPTEPTLTPEQIAAREKELDAREARLKEQEQAQTAVQARMDKRLDEIDAKLAQISQDDKVTLANRTAQEKAAIVEKQLVLAFANDDGEFPAALGDAVVYKPVVTLSNNTSAGLITFEKGITYNNVPQEIVNDLQERAERWIAYQESLHVRDDQVLNSGTISGGGK